MLSVINILILFFIVLIILQIFLATYKNTEGLSNMNDSIQQGIQQSQSQAQQQGQQNQPTATPQPLPAQSSCGFAQLTQQQVDSLMALNQEVQDISGNVATLQTQVQGMIGAQQQYAQNMTPSTPPKITGAVSSS